MRDNPNAEESTSVTGQRLHQLLLVGGLGLFVVGLLLSGMLGGPSIISLIGDSEAPSMDEGMPDVPTSEGGDDEEDADADDEPEEDEQEEEEEEEEASDDEQKADDEEEEDRVAVFQVNEFSVPNETTAGSTFEVGVGIENVGDAAGTTNVTIAFDGEVVYDEETSLTPNETISIETEVDTEGYEPGNYTVTLTVGGSEATTEIELTEEEDDDDGSILPPGDDDEDDGSNDEDDSSSEDDDDSSTEEEDDTSGDQDDEDESLL